MATIFGGELVGRPRQAHFYATTRKAFAMVKTIASMLVVLAATAAPVSAGTYVDQYPGYWAPQWAAYPNYAARIPYGIPFVPFTRTVQSFPQLSPVPLPTRVYYVPQQQPLYNVPPYPVIEPYAPAEW